MVNASQFVAGEVRAYRRDVPQDAPRIIPGTEYNGKAAWPCELLTLVHQSRGVRLVRGPPKSDRF